MRHLTIVVAGLLTACAAPGEKSKLKMTFSAALENSTGFNYKKTVAVGDKSETETRVAPRPKNFADDFPTDESYFHDSPQNLGCFDLSRREDTVVAVAISECAKKTMLFGQKLLWRGDTLKFISFDVRRSNEIYEIELRSDVEFDETGKYLRHSLVKSYRLKALDVRLSTSLLGERTP